METKEHLVPGQQTQVIIIIDTQVSASCDVSDAHRVIPHNETAGPLRPGKFQSPQRASLGAYVAAFIDDDAGRNKFYE